MKKNRPHSFNSRCKQPKINLRDLDQKSQFGADNSNKESIFRPFILQCFAGVFGYFFVTCVSPALTKEQISYICAFAMLSLLIWFKIGD